MVEDYTPRRDDHLVEPMYEALREPPSEPEPERPDGRRGRGGCAGLLLVGALLAGLFSRAL